MQNFHENLRQTQQKSISLRNAKLEYLLSADPEYHHPQFWAAFELIGNDSTLNFRSESYFTMRPFIGLIILCTVLYALTRVIVNRNV